MNKIIISLLSGVIIILWFIKQELESNLYFNSFHPDPIEVQRLKTQNNELKIELLQKEALTTIYSEAIKKGFVKGPFITP